MSETTCLSSERRRMKPSVACVAAWILGALAATSGSQSPATAQTIAVNPSTMPRIGTIAERYQSYNIEMLEVTGGPSALQTRDLLAASRPASVGAVSYHHYGATSRRCAAIGMQTTVEAALSEEWLRRTDETLAYYKKLRDEFQPGKPFWLTETVDAACGGNPWARSFLDTFRYLDQLGRLAKQNVQVVAHNTLVASDYGLLDDKTLEPNPNYWGALLWHRVMGTTVLESRVTIQAGLHLYAHCLRNRPGGVALLAINKGETLTSIDLPTAAERHTLTAEHVVDRQVRLNGQVLTLQATGELPPLQSEPIPAGTVEFPPSSITFLSGSKGRKPALSLARRTGCSDEATSFETYMNWRRRLDESCSCSIRSEQSCGETRTCRPLMWWSLSLAESSP